MDGSNASVEINLSEGKVVVSGTEEFVEKNIQTIFSFIEKNKMQNNESKKEIKQSPIQEITKSEDVIDGKKVQDSKNDKYIEAGVYHIDNEDGSISILKRLPGKNKAEKMKNIALIVLYIRKHKIEGKELVPICEKHNCFDASNFASVFKNEKTNIIRKGNGQKWTIELTQPGEEAAIKLLEEMTNDKK